MLRWWTIGRATSFGVPAGLIALVLWPLYARWQETLLLPFSVALAVAATCGLSILWITAADILLHRRRGGRLFAIRTFDVALALLLSVPSLIELNALLSG